MSEGKLAVYIIYDKSKDNSEVILEEIKTALRPYDIFIDSEVID